MAAASLDRLVGRCRVVARMDDLRGRPDADLLRLFARDRDEAAFELLVRRHGRMVMGVCSRVLRERADAEDAFQATFLLLVRRAGGLRSPGGLANWLYGVARRTALEARTLAARRRQRELASGGRQPPDGYGHQGADAPRSPEHAELAAALDQEVAALPGRYRLPVVLCDLGGKTRAEAAAELGCPEGTVASRLARGRSLLAARLTRRGIAPAVAVTVPLVAVPPALAASTARLAALVAGGGSGALSPTLHLLASGGPTAMLSTVLKPALAAAACAALAVGGLAATRTGFTAEPPAAEAAKPAAETPAEQWAKLKAEYDADVRANTKPAVDKKTGAVIPNAFEVRQPRADKYTARLLDLGRSADEETAVAALTLATTGWVDRPESDEAFDLLVERFADTPELLRRFAVEHHRISYAKKAGRLQRVLAVSDDPFVRTLTLFGLARETEPHGGPDGWPGEGDRKRGKAVALYNRVLAEGPEFVEYGRPDGGRTRIPVHEMAKDALKRLAPTPKPGG
ncbi:MAG: sigma-70 family RNA polymerase sigma factor [Gemmataceae bacterium]|nr:sigma-70 family RNA polymerase sigma factor [Gemmataceae bacterium]